MKKKKITPTLLNAFQAYLRDDEKSQATMEKYMRDVRCFAMFAAEREIDKGLLLEYKAELERGYALSSANSMLTAVNAFLRFAGWVGLKVKPFRVQKQTYCPEEKELTKEEYQRLIKTAGEEHNERLSLLIQTICGTGIRVSELQYITLEAVKKREAVVTCKGKTRTVFIVPTLRNKLLNYARDHEIRSGSLFVTKTGKPMNRSNIWKEMKALCKQAGVSPDKVFPHNLRHLFARTFYGIEKDIAKLADILGHSNINTTRIYIMTTGAEHRNRLERMQLVC